MALAQGRELVLGFLHPVLAEQPLSGAVGRLDRLGRLGLADRHQGHVVRRARGRAGRLGDRRADHGETLGRRRPIGPGGHGRSRFHGSELKPRRGDPQALTAPGDAMGVNAPPHHAWRTGKRKGRCEAHLPDLFRRG